MARRALARCARCEASFQARRGERLEIAPPAFGVGVLARDDFALLGKPQRAVDGSRRLREHRLVARAAAAANGAATAVKEAQAHAVRLADIAQALGGFVERPVRGDVA